MEPAQLLGALASACPPRSPREALVLACHGVCLLLGGPDLMPLSSSSSASSSLLHAFHESPNGVYPTQAFTVQGAEGGLGQGKGEAEDKEEEEEEKEEEDRLYIKPVGHGPCSRSDADDEEDHNHPAVLVLFGRRQGLSQAAVHRLELGVRDYIYILPSTRRGSMKRSNGEEEGAMAEEKKTLKEEEEDTVRIRGEPRPGYISSSSSSIYLCRFDALAARLATHFLSKLRPELYTAQQLPSFSDVMRTEDSDIGGGKGSTSSSPPSLLLNELLPFLSCPSMLRLTETARQFHRPLAQEERALTLLLQRDFPAAAAAAAPSSSTSSSIPASSSSSTTGNSTSTSTPPPPPPHVHRAPHIESPRAVYRRLFRARLPPLSSRRLYRHDDYQIPWCHLPPSPHHPHYPFPPSLPHPLYYLPGGLGGGRGGGRPWEARPRYLPTFGAPPLFFPGGRGPGEGGREGGGTMMGSCFGGRREEEEEEERGWLDGVQRGAERRKVERPRGKERL